MKEGLDVEETRIINVLGLSIGMNTLIALVATIALIWVFCVVSTKNLSVDKPNRWQLILEWVLDFVRDLVGGAISDPKVQMYNLLGMTLLLFVFVSNMIGLGFILTLDEYSMWKSPTADPIVCLALALIMIIMSHYLGVDKLGFKKYVSKAYMQPSPFMMPINIIEEFTNTLTLALRLYGNVFAGEVLLGLIATLGGIIFPITWIIGIPLQMVWQGFSVFIGSIQAYIFVTLTMVYMSHKVETEH